MYPHEPDEPLVWENFSWVNHQIWSSGLERVVALFSDLDFPSPSLLLPLSCSWNSNTAGPILDYYKARQEFPGAVAKLFASVNPFSRQDWLLLGAVSKTIGGHGVAWPGTCLGS